MDLEKLSKRMSLTHAIAAGIQRHFRAARIATNDQVGRESKLQVHVLGLDFEVIIRDRSTAPKKNT